MEPTVGCSCVRARDAGPSCHVMHHITELPCRVEDRYSPWLEEAATTCWMQPRSTSNDEAGVRIWSVALSMNSDFSYAKPYSISNLSVGVITQKHRHRGCIKNLDFCLSNFTNKPILDHLQYVQSMPKGRASKARQRHLLRQGFGIAPMLFRTANSMGQMLTSQS